MSTLRTNTITNAAGSKSVPVDTVVDGSAKAWCQFQGTGTVTLFAAFNVSSVTDNGTGDYTINFTTPLAASSFSAVASCVRAAGRAITTAHPEIYATTSIRIICADHTAQYDSGLVSVGVFR